MSKIPVQRRHLYQVATLLAFSFLLFALGKLLLHQTNIISPYVADSQFPHSNSVDANFEELNANSASNKTPDSDAEQAVIFVPTKPEETPKWASLNNTEKALIYIEWAERKLKNEDRLTAAQYYGKAFEHDAKLADNPTHAYNLIQCLSWGHANAMPVIRAFPTPAVVDALMQRMNEPGASGAARARELIVQTGNGHLLDWAGYALADLRAAETCEEKTAAALKLKKLGDERAIPDLEQLRGSKLKLIFNGKCGKREADDALSAIAARRGK